MNSSCQLRALFLPPSPRLKRIRDHVPGTGPSPNALFELLAQQGIAAEIMDPFSWPINPLAGRHSLLESLDLARSVKVLRDGDHFDLIVSIMDGAALFPLAFRHLMTMRTPIALWDIGLSENWRLRNRVLDFVVPRADAIFVLARSHQPYVANRWRPSGAVEVVFHRVDSTFFSPQSGNCDDSVLCIGEDAGRDIDTLMAAAAQLRAPIIVKTRTHQHRVRQMAFPGVTVLTDWLSYLELRALYDKAAVLVVPLLRAINASGVTTILEASAMAKALVVSDSPSIRDFVIPDETCLIVPIGDSAALADAIARLRASPDLRHSLGQRAREFVLREFSNEVFAQRLAGAMRRLVTH